MNGRHMIFGGAKLHDGYHYEWRLIHDMAGLFATQFTPAYLAAITGVRFVIRYAVL